MAGTFLVPTNCVQVRAGKGTLTMTYTPADGGKPVEYKMSIKPETIDRKEAATAAMLNCLAMDCLLRRSGRTLLASLKDRGEDMTQGRGKKALFEAVEAERGRYKRISV